MSAPDTTGTLSSSVGAALLLCTVLVWAPQHVFAEAAPVRPVEAIPLLAPALQQSAGAGSHTVLAEIELDVTILRRRAVEIQFDRLSLSQRKQGARLKFDFFDDVALSGVIDRTANTSPRAYTLVGRLDGVASGNFTIVVRGDVLYANIREDNGGFYQIRYLGGGAHDVREIDATLFPPCGVTAEDEAAVPPKQPANAIAGAGCSDDGSVIDMLVVYTAQARNAQGGTSAIEALIALAEAETNQAYVNSLIDTSVRVVQAIEVDYTETGNSAADRNRLVAVDDGYLDEVHDLRNEFSADVVSLIVASLDGCGRAAFSIAAGNTPVPEIAFNVVRASCATGNYTFGHELGHNQGARHDRAGDNSDNGAFLYSHGYIEPAGVFRTVMGRSTPGVPRLQFFSNPDLLFSGLPMGVAVGQPDSAHNALSITNSAFNVANFRSSRDCDQNGVCDEEELADGSAGDCNNNGQIDACERNCNDNGIPDECDIANGTSFDCNDNGIPDECETDCNNNGIEDGCEVADGTGFDCTSNGILDECEPDCNGNSAADSCDIKDGTSVDNSRNGVPDECEPPLLYVDVNATGTNRGTSWEDAFTSLHDATTIAVTSNGSVKEIWVAAGTYTPDGPGGDRSATFELASGVGHYGGFTGAETSRDQRDPRANVTILSGDLNGDDVDGWVNRSDNVEHVVTAEIGGSDIAIDGFTITGGYAPVGGSRGGGMGVSGATMVVRNCIFRYNEAYGGGGLGVDYAPAHVEVSGCLFIDNKARNAGGGISVRFDAVVHVSDSAFIRNTVTNTGSTGGGLNATVDSIVNITGCTFAGSAAGFAGGAVTSIFRSHVTITDSILWDNTAPSGINLYAKGYDSPSTLAVSYSDVQGGAAGVLLVDGGELLWGASNFEDDPLLDADALHLLPGSPCINRSNPSAEVAASRLDIDGEPRVGQCRADVGADESPFFIRDCNNNNVADACEIEAGSGTDVNLNLVLDSCEPNRTIYAAPGACPGAGTAVSPYCRIQDAIDAAGDGLTEVIKIILMDGTYTGIGNRDLRIGEKRLTIKSENGADGCIIDAQGVGRVFDFSANEGLAAIVRDVTITGGLADAGGGIRCDGASPSIVDCIIRDNRADSGGGFYANNSLAQIEGCAFIDNDAETGGGIQTLLGSVKISACTLTGNHAESGGAAYFDGGNPVIEGCAITDNRADRFAAGLYFINARGLVENSTIARNEALSSTSYAHGGGMHLEDSDTTIVDCVFDANTAVSTHVAFTGFGGAIGIFDGIPLIQRCTFSRNSAGNALGGYGGAIRARSSGSMVVEDSLFAENAATLGGAVYMSSGTHTFRRCTFERNEGQGGAAYLAGSTTAPTFRHCTFDANSSPVSGGAILTLNVSGTFDQCFFRGNIAADRGGALYGVRAAHTVIQSVLHGNSAGGGGGAIFHHTDHEDTGRGLEVNGCTIHGNTSTDGAGGIGIAAAGTLGTSLTMTNTIVWGNSGTLDALSNQLSTDCEGCSASLNYNCIEGWTGSLGGVGNVGGDPLFIDADGLDDLAGTADDNLHLYSGSAAIDAGENAAVPEGLITDLDENPRFTDDLATVDTGNSNGQPPIVDMGVYEGGVDCNQNGTPDPEDIASGGSLDCTGNGVPDECEPDCDGNEVADSCDIADETHPDCNLNRIPDLCDIAADTSGDCNGNAMPDECEVDQDNDGVIDDCDGCPTDAEKVDPGACGCNMPDTDSDNDSVADCVDVCPGFDDRDDDDFDTVPNGCDICAGFDDRDDGDLDTVPDGCDLCAGFDDRIDGDGDTVPDGCDQCIGFDDRLDCNDNATPDGCDVVDNDSFDLNGNGVPDECDPPAVTREGPRYLMISPQERALPIALTISSTDGTCIDAYVDFDPDPELAALGIGVIVDEPVYRSASEWNVVHLRSGRIAPGTTYDVGLLTQIDQRTVRSAGIAVATALWADVDGDGSITINDVRIVVDHVKEIPGLSVSRLAADLWPCDPDAKVNVTDLTQAVDSLKSLPYPCAAACP